MAVRKLHLDHDVHPDDRRILHEQNMARYEAEQRSLGSLVTELTEEVTTLFRQEVELVKTEASAKARSAKNGGIAVAIGATIAFAGILVLLMAAAYGLAAVMDPGWASLIVGGAALIIGAIIAMVGARRLRPAQLSPERSPASVRADMNLAREKARGQG